MRILGVSSFYHDSSACLLEDGRVVMAIEEERLSRKKHDNAFPKKALLRILEETGLEGSDIDCVAYYEKPLLKFERIIDNFVKTWPLSLKPFIHYMPEWLSEKIKVEKHIRDTLNFRGEIFFIRHHLSHASAAFFTSGLDKSAVLTIDGVGEYETCALWRGEKNKLEELCHIDFPDSIGLLYSTLTAFLGFQVNEGEYKMMGMAAYGKPVYRDKIMELVDLKEDGSFKLDMRYFSYREGGRMWSRHLERLLGEPRTPSEDFSQRHKDIAASIQEVTEEIYWRILNHLHSLVGGDAVSIGGGVALNSLANGKIQEKTPFKRVHIFGPSGDGGASLGAAIFANCSILGNQRSNIVGGLDLGTEYSNAEIENVLKNQDLGYGKFEDENELIEKTAKLLLDDQIIGWFQGRMEFGPRALGQRSILANPGKREMKDKVNLIKKREEFRPFAGSVIAEEAVNIFECPRSENISPFMNFCFKVKEEKRDLISAIVHKDGTCRIQTVTESNPRYYKLIKKFGELSGVPVVLNTSFNVAGEPIVENPEQALKSFLGSNIDYLIMGDYLVSK